MILYSRITRSILIFAVACSVTELANAFVSHDDHVVAAGAVQDDGSVTADKSGADESENESAASAGAAIAESSFELAVEGLPEQGMWKCDPAFGDVNGDGRLDLAVHPRLGRGARVWLSKPEMEWEDSSEGLGMDTASCGGGLELVDINRDGDLDLVVADHCKGVFVYLGDGEGNWEEVTAGLHPSELIPAPGRESMYLGAEDVTAGDIDGDGHLDLLVGASDEGGVSVYLGDGTGRNWRRVENTLPNFGWAMRVRLQDMNGDGTLDAVFAHSQGPRVWLNDGSGGFSTASEGLPTPIISGIFVALDISDLNRDGRPDIVVANWSNGPEAFVQNEDGSWTKLPDVFPDLRGGAYGVAAGRINSDEKVDLLVSGRMKSEETGFVRGVFVLYGTEDGAWKWSDNNDLPATGLGGMSGVGLADLNKDGIDDLVACGGLLVETDQVRTAPTLPARILVWLTQPKESKAITRVDEHKE